MRAVRKIEIDGDVAMVPLTQGYVALIDAADVAAVADFNWCASIEKHTVYAMRKSWSDGVQRTVKMHRLILQAAPGQYVDHKDGNGLNNRRANLRYASHAQNMWNRRSGRRNVSGMIGALLLPKSGKWRSSIQVNGKIYRLGVFETAEEAHEAYLRAARELHGEYCAV